MKHLLVKLLSLIILGILTFQEIEAYDFEVDGIYYNITSMSNLEVEVTYRELQRASINGWSYYINKSYSGEINLPETVNYNNKTFIVSRIGEMAFGGRVLDAGALEIMFETIEGGLGSNVTSVNLPSTIRSLGKYSFRGCLELSNLKLNSGLTEMGDGSLCYVPNLKNIILPNTIIKIGNYCFFNTGLEMLTIPNNVNSIGEWSIIENQSLTSLIIGNKVDSIGKNCIRDNRSLLEIFFLSAHKPDNMSSSSFNNNHNFLEIYVPSSKNYSFGKDYISFSEDSFVYDGQSHNIDWSNNLKAYKCEIPERECITKENNAGEHTQYLTATYSNGVDFTVEIPYDYTINKAPMTLTVNNVQREYGEPNPAFSCNITGWVNGENEQVIGITPSFDCEANQRSNVGDYRILASLEAPNYEITYQYGTLSILKAPLATSVINSTKIYGNPNPQFDLSFSGLKNGETSPSWEVQPTINTTATEKSSVGDYEVTASNGDATNYNISSYSPGVLSVTKRDLTAKANDCERFYGEENPEFTLSYSGFVNGDSETVFTSTPIPECVATMDSNAGTYPITVNGGSAENYNFIYQDGTLIINPLNVGFKDVYNSVTFDDMSVSVTEDFFYYVPEIFGPYNEEDFWLELMALDKDNRYPSQQVTIISGGEYAGVYINYSTFMLGAGKYIFNITSKGTNPNVVVNPSRAYVTVNRASTNLEWNASSPIRVKVGEQVDLGISYQADLWCTFNTDYDKELISLSSEGATSRNPHWYATGLKEGRTYLEFSIDCKPNDFGFYDFSDSSILYKEIIVSGYYEDGIAEVPTESDGTIIVYNLQGVRMNVSTRDELHSLEPGLYIINGKKEIIR